MAKQENTSSKFLFNKSDTAEIMGVSVQALSRWNIEPVSRKGREVFYYLPDIIAYQKQRDSVVLHDLSAQRARLAKEQADRVEMANAEMRGFLIDVRKVADQWALVSAYLRNSMLALPTYAATILENKPRSEILDLLTDLVNKRLTEISETPPGLERRHLTAMKEKNHAR